MSASSIFTLMRGHRQSSAPYGRLTEGMTPQPECHPRINRSIAIPNLFNRGELLPSLRRDPDAVAVDSDFDAGETLTDGLSTWSSTGATVWGPWYRAHLAKAHAQVGQFDEAWRHTREAMTTIENSKKTWWEVEVNRIAGEIARRSPGVDALDAEKKFERALSIARQQQAKSWELCASMSLARLWRDQGKVQQARELLAPVYGWFTEGFDTRDLREAKALLEELAS